MPAAALAVLALAGCGSDQDPTIESGQSVSTASTTASTAAPTTTVPRTFSGDLTSTDGYRYRITLEVGDKLTAASADECATAAPPAGRAAVRVTLTIANTESNRPAPSPPVRIELNGPAGRQQVMVRDAGGTCTFTPRVPQIGAGQSVVYRGTTPSLAADAAPGSAGQIEVAVSETRFSLSAPVP